MTFTSNDIFVFKGLFINDEPFNGQALYKNNDLYEGYIFNNKPHGEGKIIYYEDGSTYEG